MSTVSESLNIKYQTVWIGIMNRLLFCILADSVSQLINLKAPNKNCSR